MSAESTQSRLPLAAAGLAVMLSLAACAGTSEVSTGGQPNAATAATPPASSADARSITTLDGATAAVPVAGKATAVYFFASGCPSCISPLQTLASVAKAHPDVVYLPVSISPYDDASSVNGFLSAAGDEGRVAALDGQARLAGALGVTSLGTLIVYNLAGAEVYRGVDPGADAVAAAFDKAART